MPNNGEQNLSLIYQGPLGENIYNPHQVCKSDRSRISLKQEKIIRLPNVKAEDVNALPKPHYRTNAIYLGKFKKKT